MPGGRGQPAWMPHGTAEATVRLLRHDDELPPKKIPPTPEQRAKAAFAGPPIVSRHENHFLLVTAPLDHVATP